MKEMIAEALEKLNRKLEKIFGMEDLRLDVAEGELSAAISESVAGLLGAYYEELDARLASDRAGRRKVGLSIERRGDKRAIQTMIGEVRYARSYYKAAGSGYCYPVDEIAGVRGYQRLSDGVSLALVDAARETSYAKSSRMITGERVSRQTVMNKIREMGAAVPVVERQREVAVLHIDADEDHVSLQDGGKTIVPLISGYEGIYRKGKRGKCVNVFHYSEYGKKPDELWEGFLHELERRYDLKNTRIYLHGDGAAWIKTGLEWLPNSVFVLDHYHKNKAIKAALSGITGKERQECEAAIRAALKNGDGNLLEDIQNSMITQWPEHQATVEDGVQYLLNNLDGIKIYNEEPEAANGGATEPHVSHVLSARLSSRPMGWSRATLRRFAPILAAGGCSMWAARQLEIPTLSAKKAGNVPVRRVLPFSLGLPHPDLSVRLPAKSGKVTPLFNALRPF